MRRIVYAAEKRILMKVVPKSTLLLSATHIEGGNVLKLYVLVFKLSVLEITVINTGRNEIKTPVIHLYKIQKS